MLGVASVDPDDPEPRAARDHGARCSRPSARSRRRPSASRSGASATCRRSSRSRSTACSRSCATPSPGIARRRPGAPGGGARRRHDAPPASCCRVELPLAMPVIVAGVRTAAVWTVGTATLSTPVGATSLGNFIFSGLQTRNARRGARRLRRRRGARARPRRLIRAARARAARTQARARGARPLAALAAPLGAGIAARRRVRPARRRRRARRSGSARSRSPSSTCWRRCSRTGCAREAGASRRGARVASARPSPSTRCATGEIDVYVDYTGTLWATLMKRSDVAGAPRARCSPRWAAGSRASAASPSSGRSASRTPTRSAMRADDARARGIAQHRRPRAALAPARDRRATTSSSRAPSGPRSSAPTACASAPSAPWIRR